MEKMKVHSVAELVHLASGLASAPPKHGPDDPRSQQPRLHEALRIPPRTASPSHPSAGTSRVRFPLLAQGPIPTRPYPFLGFRLVSKTRPLVAIVDDEEPIRKP